MRHHLTTIVTTIVALAVTIPALSWDDPVVSLECHGDGQVITMRIDRRGQWLDMGGNRASRTYATEWPDQETDQRQAVSHALINQTSWSFLTGPGQSVEFKLVERGTLELIASVNGGPEVRCSHGESASPWNRRRFARLVYPLENLGAEDVSEPSQ